ncbi:MAG: hypothetical protein ABFS28_16910 [Bacteroidota bacterium]
MALIKSVRGFTPVMDSNTIVAAGSVVLENMIKGIAKNYLEYAGWYK